MEPVDAEGCAEEKKNMVAGIYKKCKDFFGDIPWWGQLWVAAVLGLEAIFKAALRGATEAIKGLAAAALYLSCVKNGKNVTQHHIADAANVTEVTIRNRVKGFKLDLNIKL